jgi:hypothetical protein
VLTDSSTGDLSCSVEAKIVCSSYSEATPSSNDSFASFSEDCALR